MLRAVQTNKLRAVQSNMLRAVQTNMLQAVQTITGCKTNIYKYIIYMN